ncbi:hypothetical protein J4457_00955 [Candidatus Woesearchaeota archaeon]|nr:hypothetical protein [Candidatus Woesearchaeota archaeon]
MGYINQNANLVLLFLLVLSVTVLVGATVYYQGNFSSINEEYNHKLESLQKLEKELTQKSSVLNKTREELVLKSERESEFTEQFTEIRSQKEVLEGERSKLTSEKESLEGQLDAAQEGLRESQAELTHEKRRVAELQTLNAQLAVEVNYWKEQTASIRSQLNACQSEGS